jgi:ribosomal-protein-alanine N-acetyltransferase
MKTLESIFDKMVAINLTPFPKLITTRLLLRQLQLSDANEIFLLRADDSVNAFIDRQKATTFDDATVFINKIIDIQNNEQGLMWAITLNYDAKLIGVIGIWNILKGKAEAEIGYELLPQYQGKGIMLEALTIAIKFGIDTLKLKTIVADSRLDNIKSINLPEKCGFSKTDKTSGQYLSYELNVSGCL